MQIVSNHLPGAISPWSAWQMLFNPHTGDEAVIYTGYLSGGDEGNTWCDDVVSDMAGWLQYPRENGALPRRLSISVGSWNDSEGYARTIDMLGRILAQIDEKYRANVSISEVPKLHVKAFAIFAGEPGTGSVDCIRLLTGSSNLTYTSMAAGNNIELDAYFSAPTDSAALRQYGIGMRDVEMQCISQWSYDQAPPVASVLKAKQPLVARRVYSASPDRVKFYADVEDAMTGHEVALQERRAAAKARTEDADMQAASDDCLNSDANS